MSILIGADIYPSKSNEEFFSSGNMDSVVGDELKKILFKADYRVFNLETPLIDAAMPIRKSGPAIKANVSTVNGIKAIGADLLTLANNHIMDQGVCGLLSTFDVLKKNGINFIGAADCLNNSIKPFIAVVCGKKIGFYACCEHEFSIASEKTPGANPFDPIESFDHVEKLRRECDYLIILYHGGKEYYPYPSPMLQKVCRKFIEKGANLVVCQHSHCIGCEEKFLDGTIVYGQGNFIFNTCDEPIERTSLLIKIDELLNVSYIPLVKCGNGVRMAEGDNAKSILMDFYCRSEQIKQDSFVESGYRKFAEERIKGYLLNFSGYGHKLHLRILNRLTRGRFTNYYVKRIYKKNDILLLQNYIECEAHRELLLEGLKQF